MPRGRAAALVVAAAACSPGPRDVAAEGRDVRVVAEDATRAPAAEAYVHVARRAHGVVALAEARHVREADAQAFAERLADELDSCATRLEAQGELVDGAARVIAIAGPRGVAEGLNVRLAPGGAVAQNALLCVLAPLRALAMPPSADGAAPGLALELTWSPGKRERVDSGKLQSGAADAGPALPVP